MTDARHQIDRNHAYLAASLAGFALNIKAETIMARPRGTLMVTRARQVAMYLAHTGFGMSLARVAAAFDRDRSTVAHSCQVIEERRDDRAFDDWIEQLSTGLETIAPLAVTA